MKRGWIRLGKVLRNAWRWLRQVSGDAAYEDYLRRRTLPAAAGRAEERQLSSQEFYLDRLRRKYTGVTRCC